MNVIIIILFVAGMTSIVFVAYQLRHYRKIIEQQDETACLMTREMAALEMEKLELQHELKNTRWWCGEILHGFNAYAQSGEFPNAPLVTYLGGVVRWGKVEDRHCHIGSGDLSFLEDDAVRIETFLVDIMEGRRPFYQLVILCEQLMFQQEVEKAINCVDSKK